MSEYKIKAHETKYSGIIFRSRLEARWAAFFDLVREYQKTNETWQASPINAVIVDGNGNRAENPKKSNGEPAYLEWEYEPIDLKKWVPDFLLKIPCLHSECPIYHELYVEVKPYRSIKEFKGEVVWDHYHSEKKWNVPSPAMFGINPEVTEWTMRDSFLWGKENLIRRLPSDYRLYWKRAGNIVQWKPNKEATEGLI